MDTFCWRVGFGVEFAGLAGWANNRAAESHNAYPKIPLLFRGSGSSRALSLKSELCLKTVVHDLLSMVSVSIVYKTM